MCSVGIVYAYCPGHKFQCEVRRENEKLCDEARKHLRMGACGYGVVTYCRYVSEAHCRNCLARIEQGLKEKKKMDKKAAK